MKQVNTTGQRVFMGTVTGGAELVGALRHAAASQSITTATILLLGGLHEITFTAYDFEKQERQPPVTVTRPLEIVGGHGTISLLEGQPHIHLHLMVAYPDAAHNIVVVGGHVVAATAFAVEYTLTSYEGNPMVRRLDVGTGLQLWDVR